MIGEFVVLEEVTIAGRTTTRVYGPYSEAEANQHVQNWEPPRTKLAGTAYHAVLPLEHREDD